MPYPPVPATPIPALVFGVIAAHLPVRGALEWSIERRQPNRLQLGDD
jgi:hypothetical protein